MDSYNQHIEIHQNVRPVIAERNLVISKSVSYGSRGTPGARSRSSGVTSGALSLSRTSGVGALETTRNKEKKELQDLNERFASYIEKVRFLEAQNRKLADELEKLKAKWGIQATHIKAMYETELAEAKRLIDEAELEKARLEKRVAALEEQLEELLQKLAEAKKHAQEIRDRIDRQNQTLAELEAELSILRRRVESLGGDRDNDKKQIALLQESINRAQIDLDNETLLHIDAENQRRTLEDELAFLRQLHEQELKELAALAYRDTTNENREFWKNQMGGALRDIQKTYDDKMDAIHSEMETFYNMKVQEIRVSAGRKSVDAQSSKEEIIRLRGQLGDLRNKLVELENRNAALQRELDNLRREKEERERALLEENDRLRSSVAQMRAELEAINKELRDLEDTKLSLELEIAAYRKLLEGEENRTGLRQVVDSLYGAITSAAGSSPDEFATVKTVIKGQVEAKTTNQRTAKGPTAIGECAADGKFVTLENQGRKDEDISGWKVSRLVNDEVTGEFVLDQGIELKASQKLKLWAKGSLPADAKPETDIETKLANWGVGNNVLTKITNLAGEDRATLLQKTIASQ